MALDFSIVMNVRHQFGGDDLNEGAYAGNRGSYAFDCPDVDTNAEAILLFQSKGVGKEQSLEINGTRVYGGVPVTDSVVARALWGPVEANNHDHLVEAASRAWSGNVMLVGAGTLRTLGNELEIASDGEHFLVDNVVVIFRTESGSLGPRDVLAE